MWLIRESHTLIGLCSVTPWPQLSAVQVQLHHGSSWGFSLILSSDVTKPLKTLWGGRDEPSQSKAVIPATSTAGRNLGVRGEVVFGGASVQFISLPELI